MCLKVLNAALEVIRVVEVVDTTLPTISCPADIVVNRSANSLHNFVLIAAVGLPGILLLLLIMVILVARIQGQQSAIPSDRQRSAS